MPQVHTASRYVRLSSRYAVQNYYLLATYGNRCSTFAIFASLGVEHHMLCTMHVGQLLGGSQPSAHFGSLLYTMVMQ